MNLGTAITGAIFIAIFMLPFIFMLQGRKKKEKQLLQSISTVANNHHCKISQHELCEEFAIGLDETANHLFFLKKTADQEIAQHVNLAEIKSCKVVKTERSVNSKDVNYKSIKNLDLQFSFLDKKNSDLLFSFYDAEENMELNGEIQTIEKWAKIVNNHLKP
ncbi:MAG: hypothetical protein CVU08_00790 [Bacteroidetes bacterium HGW-Bacteroidetes-3]|jgi:hypothetical protein|nr:MAG: hypothetical protein CVU08_00790 [Bacteroidetes bacterium HGW-Bacteroidetes-3]